MKVLAPSAHTRSFQSASKPPYLYPSHNLLHPAMFISQRSTTLLCYLTVVLALVSASQATAPVARDHVQLNRMMKKRGIAPLYDIPIARAISVGPVAEPGAEPPSFSDTATPSGSSATPSVTPSASADTTPSASSAPVSTSDPASVSASVSSHSFHRSSVRVSNWFFCVGHCCIRFCLI